MKIAFYPIILALFVFSSCNNNQTSSTENTDKETPATDSLLKEVDKDHNTAMAKMSRLNKAQKLVEEALDSISKLPAKAQKLAAPYKFELDSILNRLKYADYAMTRWMEEFNRDSALNDIQQRLDYLTKEKLKASKVKEAVLTSWQKADSLLRQKF